MVSKKESYLKKHTQTIIILVLYLFYVYPILVPFSPPIVIGEKAQSFYDLVESLPDEPTVLMTYDYGAVSYPYFQGFQEAFMKHIYQKGGTVILVSFGAAGPMMYKMMQKSFASVWDTKTYGEDYVFLGFVPGGETGVASFMADIRETIALDFEGNPIDSLPIMENVNMATDFDLVVNCETSTTIGDGFVRQVASAYGVKLALVGPGGPTWEPYYPEQIQGNLYPLPQAPAEDEKTLGMPGNASSQIGLLFTGSLFYLLIIFAGNVIPRIGKRSENGNTD